MQATQGAKSIRDWANLLDDRGSALFKRFDRAYHGDTALIDAAADVCRQTVHAFGKHFGWDRQAILVRSTGRVNLLGMHIDHRGGSVNPIAIKELFFLAEPREDDVLVMRDVKEDMFPEETFRIRDCLPDGKISDWDAWCHDEHEKRKDDPSVTWSNYVRAAVLYLQHLHTREDGTFAPALKGMNVMIGGHVPRAAGLSSSSSIVVATAKACLRLHNIDLAPMAFIDACGFGEWYVGTRGGSGDHAAISFGQPGCIGHMTSFPLSVEAAPFPAGYRILLANSMIEAKKRSGARDVFNNRVASYIFGFMMMRKRFPRHAQKLEHLRDVNPANLGVDEAEIYRMLKTLPESAGRQEVIDALPDRRAEVDNVCRSHAEPEEGYKIRQVCMYGVAECLRSDMAPGFLHDKNIKGFAELINLSHDGDRVSRVVGGRRVQVDNAYPDSKLDALIADLASGDPQRRERARLWRQPGGYSVSVPDIDLLVDTALQAPGVLAAGLVGAGMGGSIIAIVEEAHASELESALVREYYEPRGLEPETELVSPVEGVAVLDV